MRKLLHLLLWGLFAGGVAMGADWLPDALAELQYFRAREYRVEGVRHLEEKQVLDAAAISPFASVFDDLTLMELRLEKHLMIRRAHVTAELPGTLVVTIEERIPVGFVAGPVLEPVDRDGQILPLDPVAHQLDLPVLSGAGGGGTLSFSQLRVLAMEVDRLAVDDPTFLAAVSEMAIDDRGDATAVVSGDLLLRFRPPLSHLRLRDGLAALEDAVLRQPDRTAAVLDLRFEDQVVVEYTEQRAKSVGQVRGL
jgi:cell division septal protein FtsQ